jgi:flagellar biosynthesis/type III secretory pathway protein FliH
MKSFHSEEFRPAVSEPASGEGKAASDFSSAVPPQNNVGFRFGQQFWERVHSDDRLRAELDQMISERVNTRFEMNRKAFEEALETERKGELEKAREQGRAAGFEVGRSAGRDEAFAEKKAEIENALASMGNVTTTVLREKENMLRSHERMWLETLEYLFESCLIPREKEILHNISEWLTSLLDEFSKTKTVRIYVSSESLRAYKVAAELEGFHHWAIQADEQLGAGDIRCECDNGGVLFSDKAALEKVRQTIRAIIQCESKN